MHFLFLLEVPVIEPPLGSRQGEYGESCPFTGPFFYISLKFLIKNSQIKKNSLSLKDPRKGASLHVPQKRGLYGNRHQFPEPHLAYLSGSPVKEPSLQVSLIELPRKEMPHS